MAYEVARTYAWNLLAARWRKL